MGRERSLHRSNPIDEDSVIEQTDPPAPARRWRDRLARWTPTLLLAAFALAMIPPGYAYTKWAWDFTEPGRYRFDINRNFRFGLKAIENGYLNLYENDIRDKPGVGERLDYTPLRLAMFQAWAAWNRQHYPNARQWQDEWAFTEPLMILYTAGRWLAAVAAMLIVRHWLRRCAAARSPDGEPPPWTGMVRAMLAFALLWFDPGVAIIAHGWPSPNLWVIPFYLWTVLFCLWDRWFIAGVVMGLGIMLQGQQMGTAAVFVLWPLLAGKPVFAFRWICGAALAFVGCTAGWMLTVRPDVQLPDRYLNWAAVIWVAWSMLQLAAFAVDRLPRWPAWQKWRWIAAAAAWVVINLPAWRTGRPGVIVATLLLSAAVIAALAWGRWSIKRYVLALSAALLLAACMPFFNASTAWWQIGFAYGAERFPNVGGNQANNLGAILHYYWRWRDVHEPRYTIGSTVLTNRQVLVAIYTVFLVVASAAMAWQWRRCGEGLLVALATPWVLFFTLMPQMSPRYAVFAAGVGAICVGRSLGMALLTWWFSALTVQQVAMCMMTSRRFDASRHWNWLFSAETNELFHRTNPGPSWATLLVAAVFLYVAMAWPWRRRRDMAE